MAERNNEKLITTDTLYTFKLEQDLQNLDKFKLKSDSTDLKGAVRYDAAQVLTEQEQAQARANIGIDLDKLGSGSGNSGDGSAVANKFDEEGKLKAEFLPDMAEALKPLDDVVEGYLNPGDNLFYTTAEYTEQIVGESGKIYLDLSSNKTYRWGGSQYILIGGVPEGGSSGDVVAEDEIVIVTATMTGDTTAVLADREAATIINNYSGKKPLYLKVEPMGVYALYENNKKFSGYYDGNLYRLVVDTDSLAVSMTPIPTLTTTDELSQFNSYGESVVPTADEVMKFVNRQMDNVVKRVNGVIPAAFLPSYVDDVIEGYLCVDGGGNEFWANDANTVVPSEVGKIYIDLNTNNTYRWSGSTFVRINPDEYTLATPEDIYALFSK